MDYKITFTIPGDYIERMCNPVLPASENISDIRRDLEEFVSVVAANTFKLVMHNRTEIDCSHIFQIEDQQSKKFLNRAMCSLMALIVHNFPKNNNNNNK